VLAAAMDERRICRFFNTRSGCWRGEACPFEHVSESGSHFFATVYSIIALLAAG